MQVFYESNTVSSVQAEPYKPPKTSKNLFRYLDKFCLHQSAIPHRLLIIMEFIEGLQFLGLTFICLVTRPFMQAVEHQGLRKLADVLRVPFSLPVPRAVSSAARLLWVLPRLRHRGLHPFGFRAGRYPVLHLRSHRPPSLLLLGHLRRLRCQLLRQQLRLRSDHG